MNTLIYYKTLPDTSSVAIEFIIFSMIFDLAVELFLKYAYLYIKSSSIQPWLGYLKNS